MWMPPRAGVQGAPIVRPICVQASRPLSPLDGSRTPPKVRFGPDSNFANRPIADNRHWLHAGAMNARAAVVSLLGCVVVLPIAGCLATSAADPAGEAIYEPDYFFSEPISPPDKPRLEVLAASTEALSDWLLPADALPVVRHHFSTTTPPGYGGQLVLDGEPSQIVPGVCRYVSWRISLSPTDPRVGDEYSAFRRYRTLLYASAADGNCSRVSNGLPASTDASGILFVRTLRKARDEVRAGRVRVRCDVVGSNCNEVWLDLPPPEYAARCDASETCVHFQFRSIQADVTGRDRLRIDLRSRPPPVI